MADNNNNMTFEELGALDFDQQLAEAMRLSLLEGTTPRQPAGADSAVEPALPSTATQMMQGAVVDDDSLYCDQDADGDLKRAIAASLGISAEEPHDSLAPSPGMRGRRDEGAKRARMIIVPADVKEIVGTHALLDLFPLDLSKQLAVRDWLWVEKYAATRGSQELFPVRKEEDDRFVSGGMVDVTKMNAGAFDADGVNQPQILLGGYAAECVDDGETPLATANGRVVSGRMEALLAPTPVHDGGDDNGGGVADEMMRSAAGSAARGPVSRERKRGAWSDGNGEDRDLLCDDNEMGEETATRDLASGGGSSSTKGRALSNGGGDKPVHDGEDCREVVQDLQVRGDTVGFDGEPPSDGRLADETERRAEIDIQEMRPTHFSNDAQSETTAPCSEPGEAWEVPAASESLLPQIFKLILGRCEATPEDLARWLQHDFAFDSSSRFTAWGLLQRHGGPCGVLASVQAWLLRQLLFASPAQWRTDSGEVPAADDDSGAVNNTAGRKEAPSSAGADVEAVHRRLNRPPVCMWHCLAEAVGCILYQATPDSTYNVALLRLKDADATQSEESLSVTAADTSCSAPALPPLQHLLKDPSAYFYLRVWRFSRIAEVVQFYFTHRRVLLQSPTAVLSLIASVALTRGISTVQSDMDESSNPLIGHFGHCAQELVNLMLTGEATSNVFDDVKGLSDDGADSPDSPPILFKGVRRSQLVGYLSEHETLRYCEVGWNFKRPRYPVWVMGSPNHYTIYFCLDARASAPSHAELQNHEVKREFDKLGSDGCDFVGTSQLRQLMTNLNLLSLFPEALSFFGPICAGNVILRNDFMAWLGSMRLLNNGSNVQDPPARRIVYHYDGQGPHMENDAPAHIHRFLVEDNELGIYDGGQGDFDAEVARVLGTRWQQCLVTSLPLVGSPVDSWLHLRSSENGAARVVAE